MEELTQLDARLRCCDVKPPAEIANNDAVGLTLAQNCNDLLFGNTFPHLTFMYKSNMKTNYHAGYKIPIRSYRLSVARPWARDIRIIKYKSASKYIGQMKRKGNCKQLGKSRFEPDL